MIAVFNQTSATKKNSCVDFELKIWQHLNATAANYIKFVADKSLSSNQTQLFERKQTNFSFSEFEMQIEFGMIYQPFEGQIFVQVWCQTEDLGLKMKS